MTHFHTRLGLISRPSITSLALSPGAAVPCTGTVASRHLPVRVGPTLAARRATLDCRCRPPPAPAARRAPGGRRSLRAARLRTPAASNLTRGATFALAINIKGGYIHFSSILGIRPHPLFSQGSQLI